VAINPTGYDGKFEAIASVQWLYIFFIITTTALGVMMARAVFLLIKGRHNAYRYAMISLIIGIIHMLTSRILRGSSLPVDGVVHVTFVTLIIFLIIKIPGIWDKVDFTRSNKKENNFSGGISAILAGIIYLSIQYFMASTHTFNGINYANAFHITTTGFGIFLILSGSLSVIRSLFCLLVLKNLKLINN